MFDHSLHTLRESARQAGVNLDFTAYGNYWTLRLMGLAGPMPLILGQALQRLAQPNEETLSRYGQTGQEPALIPIRQLIKSLADHYLSSVPDEPIQNPHVFWASTRWMTFTTDVSAPTRQALDTVLEHTPGARDKHPQQTSPLKSGKHWRSEPSSSSESAVLVFCPVPSFGVQDEAAWRMLAHLAQDPFYQRLRVEFQLGYAVFSGFRQIAGQGGLLFGVQSPGASVAELVQHIADFVQRMPALIEAADLGTQRKTLAAQLDSADMESPNKAEMLWQAHLAGHGMDYLNQLHTAVISLKKTTLDTAAGQLEKAHAGWLILSNSCLLKK
jgi:secreted Zn-dependent insulinase-like peptidase